MLNSHLLQADFNADRQRLFTHSSLSKRIFEAQFACSHLCQKYRDSFLGYVFWSVCAGESCH